MWHSNFDKKLTLAVTVAVADAAVAAVVAEEGTINAKGRGNGF